MIVDLFYNHYVQVVDLIELAKGSIPLPVLTDYLL